MGHIRVDLLNTNNKWVGFGLANVDTFIICVGFGSANIDTTRITTLTYDHMLHYNQIMTLNADNDHLLCKVFPANL